MATPRDTKKVVRQVVRNVEIRGTGVQKWAKEQGYDITFPDRDEGLAA